MALTYTPAATMGAACPDFQLPSVDGKSLRLSDWKGSRVLAVAFICGHCPYVLAIEDRLLELAKSYSKSDVAFVGICSNDPSDHPEDSSKALLQRWKDKSYSFPYLIDETQTVAKSFGAVCTPDFFIYDEQRRLAYRGRLDDSWKNPSLVKKREMKAAVDHLVQGHKPSTDQIPSMGCSIKWKSENS